MSKTTGFKTTDFRSLKYIIRQCKMVTAHMYIMSLSYFFMSSSLVFSPRPRSFFLISRSSSLTAVLLLTRLAAIQIVCDRSLLIGLMKDRALTDASSLTPSVDRLPHTQCKMTLFRIYIIRQCKTG